MASEVPTNDRHALVTCELFTFKRIFTFKPPCIIKNKGVTFRKSAKVPDKFKDLTFMNFSHIVRCIFSLNLFDNF